MRSVCWLCQDRYIEQAIQSLEDSISQFRSTSEVLETDVIEFDRVIQGIASQIREGTQSHSVLRYRLRDAITSRRRAVRRLHEYRGRCQKMQTQIAHLEDSRSNTTMIQTMMQVLEAGRRQNDVVTLDEVDVLQSNLKEMQWDTEEINQMLVGDDDDEVQVPVYAEPFVQQVVTLAPRLPPVVIRTQRVAESL